MDPSTCLICSFTGPGLHRFPRDKKRLKAWLVAIKRMDLLESEHGSSIVYNSGRLCNAHFADSHFYGKDRKKLSKKALPSLSGSGMEESATLVNTQECSTTQCGNNDDISEERSCVTLESSVKMSIKDERCDGILNNEPAASENGELKSKDAFYPLEKLIEENVLQAINGNKEVEKIIGATNITGELMLLIKWKGVNEADLLPSTFAKKNFPELLIEFYEGRIIWAPVNQAE